MRTLDRGEIRRWVDSPAYVGGVFDARSGHLHPLPPERLQSLLLSKAAVCDNQYLLHYYRPTQDHRLLFGGRAKSGAGPRHIADALRTRMLRFFPGLSDVRITHAWGGVIDMTLNHAPDFGRLPAPPGRTERVYYLQGFSGHGVALTGLAGRLVAEALHGDATRFDIFSRLRHRTIPGGTRVQASLLALGTLWYQLRDACGKH